MLPHAVGAPVEPCADASGGVVTHEPPAPIFFPPPPAVFFQSTSSFFYGAHQFFLGGTKMSFQKKRFYFEADEANYLRLQMILNKTFIQQKDFQNIVASYLHNLTKQKR